jgi:hypothetical protein
MGLEGKFRELEEGRRRSNLGMTEHSAWSRQDIALPREAQSRESWGITLEGWESSNSQKQ